MTNSSKLHFIFFFSSSLIIASACKPSLPPTSGTQHTFGNTAVQRDTFVACNKSDLRADFPATHKYLDQLKTHIATANAKTFSGNLAPENICIVLSKVDTGIGGGAFGDSGRIEVERATITKAANDAEVAAVLCHEMAHVSMRHLRTTQIGPKGEKLDFSNAKGPEHYFTQLGSNPAYRREKERLDKLNQRYKSIDYEVAQIGKALPGLFTAALPKDIFDGLKNDQNGTKKAMEYLERCSTSACLQLREQDKKREALNREKFELHNSLIPAQEFVIYKLISSLVPKEVFLTWAEREADEVGFEFCVRAGFEIESLKALPKRRLKQDSDSTSLRSIAGCRAAISKALPKIGSSNDPYGRVHEIPISDESFAFPHPENCWRLFNIEREALLHSKDFTPFMKNLQNVIPGGIEKAKQEINQSKG